MKFSIIIPVYNVEKYLAECVESVLLQTYLDFEIILIDDGSTDQSGALCDLYKQQDERVKVIHQKNNGLSEARNTGIRVAKGEYVIFLDSDDYWDDKNALEKIHKLIQKNEGKIITWRHKKLFESTGEIVKTGKNLTKQYVKAEKEFKIAIKTHNFLASACRVAIPKKLFQENDLFFEKGVKSEDIEWCARLICVGQFVYSNLDFYVYRQRSGSISHSLTEKTIQDLIHHYQNIENLIAKSPSPIVYKLKIYLAEQIANFIIMLSRWKNFDGQIIFLKQHKKYLKYCTVKRSKIIAVLIRLIGIKNTIKLLQRI